MKILLWLDDIRDPFKNDSEWLTFSPILRPYKVIWVKNYDEFISWIKLNKLPDAICFDHDLGWDKNDNEMKSGFDCAKWLIDYCIDNDLDIPEYAIQSANPVGKDNISSIIESYKRFKK